MIQFFGIPIDRLTQVLLLITCVLIATVLLLALSNAIFFKIGVRNISRRRLQMGLIVFALMLSTTLLSSVLATGDVLTATVQSVAIYNWGNIDEVVQGGHGPLGLYSEDVYYSLRAHLQGTADVTAIGAALREDGLLVADQTSRQVRSKVTALAILPDSEQGFGGMQDVSTKAHRSIAALQPDQTYLNQTTAQLLNAQPGDTLYLYSERWPGRRYLIHVAAIVGDDGLVGDNPYLLAPLQFFQNIEGSGGNINRVFIANRGGGGVNGVDLSDKVTDQISQWLPGDVHVEQVKQQGVQNSQKAQDIFSRIFSLFSLFALAIGLLLIFLIFVLLAAERRAEMGMARAIGVQRRHLVLMYLFEGTVYDLLSSFIGLLFGLGVGLLLINILGPILQRFNFPLKFTFQPHSLIVAYCLGVIFTFCSVVLASWLVSRMTVVEAMRDLPEPNRSALTLSELALRSIQLFHPFHHSRLSTPVPRSAFAYGRKLRRILLEQLPDLCIGIIRELTSLGFLPLLAGLWLMRFGLENALIIPFSLGLSLLVLGCGLLLKAFATALLRLLLWVRYREGRAEPRSWRPAVNGLFAAIVGSALVAYWALPFDALVNFGLPRFQGGIEVFFVAGVMMVIGAVWVLVTNARLLARPWLAFSARLPGFYALTKLASAYPLHRRFRTGLNVIMFSLVVFAMTVMAVITNAMQNTYVDINTQTGGYDIQATSYFKPLPDLNSALQQHGIAPDAFAAIGSRSTTVVGVIQLSATTPRWYSYPAQIVGGAFLQGYGLHLSARANGFSSDDAVWDALQAHPDDVLIDSSALPYNPNALSNSGVYDPNVPQASDVGAPATPPNFDPQTTFAMSGVYQGDKNFPATPLWIAGFQGRKAIKVTVIGIVDNSDSAHFGLYVPQSAYSASIGNDRAANGPESQSYYFKVAHGHDVHTEALALGSAFLDYGLEATILEDAIWQVRGPRIFLSDVLLGVVGMTLLLGVAALAITGTRAVIERRQQIGMLRAMGCSRRLVQGAFLLESFLVGLLGSLLGIVLGLILANNIFAANFFEQYQTGLTFSIPWQQLQLIIAVSLFASLLGALLPAWQAGRIAPAEALRYS